MKKDLVLLDYCKSSIARRDLTSEYLIPEDTVIVCIAATSYNTSLPPVSLI